MVKYYPQLFVFIYSAIQSDDSPERKTNVSTTILSTELFSESSPQVRNAWEDFLNFSSLIGMLEGHGSFSRGSRHRVRDTQIFFAGSFRRTFHRAVRRQGGRWLWMRNHGI